jgi:hypothetical protein
MMLLGTQIIELQSDWIKVNKDSERMWNEAGVPQTSTYFPKLWNPPENSRH